MDSNSSDSTNEDFEGFIVSPEEKSSYKFWTRKRRSSEAFDSDSDNDVSEDDDEEDEDNQDDYDDDEDCDDVENEEPDDPIDDINIQDSGGKISSSNTDQCPVCLMSLREQLLGTPNNCPHVFCFECIQEWAKNATTCPVGRKPFNEILVHAKKKGPILQRIPVEERKAGDDEEEEDDPTYCEVCGECNREDRMLLCDGCENGYHMECLTPPVEFVPLDEWFCPPCSSHQEPEEEEERGDDQLIGVPRARTTRGRPRGSTARRVSGSERTATTRRARTVASTRGRGRTGRGRGRGSSRGRGRGGRRPSTKRRSSSTRKTTTKTGKRRRRKKRRYRRTKKAGTSSTKKVSKTKTLKPTKKRRNTEEDEVSPFIYEPKRRGRTVHARLLESLSTPGPSTEPSRSTSIGKMPFPSRVEPSCSFSLFGNAFALHDFNEKEEDVQGTTQKDDQAKALSSESSNPDLLGSIFQGLDTLHTSSTQLSRDGKVVTNTDQSRVEGSPARNATCKSNKDSVTTSEDENKIKSEVDMNEEKKPLRENMIISKESDIPKVSSKDNRDAGEECSRGNTFKRRALSKAPEQFAVSCSKPAEIRQPQQIYSTSAIKRSSSPPSKPMSSKSALSGFRIPKRSSSFDSQCEPDTAYANVKREQILDSSICKFKIPKRTKSSSDDSSKHDSSSVLVKNSNTEYIGQRLATCSTSSGVRKIVFSNIASPNKVFLPSACGATTTRSSCSSSNSVRPVMRDNFQRRNSFNSSATITEPSVTNASIMSRCHANKLSSVSHSHTAFPSTLDSIYSSGPCINNSSNVTSCRTQKRIASSHAITTSSSNSTSANALSVTNASNLTTCHTKKFNDILQSHATTLGSFPPLTKVAPLIDNLKPVKGKEQRRSNIEIIKMLQEKQRNMREQISDDPKVPSGSLPRRTNEVHSRLLPKEGLHNSDKSPSCSRGVKLPVAIVKPSPQIASTTIATSSVLPSSSADSSPVKSIASGIIDAHSSNTQEFKRVRSESTAIDPTRAHLDEKAAVQKQDEKVACVNGDRDQQRKLGIVRLQRHQQIVDEVKLALKPFYRRGEITKDDYKLIMKKSVEKIKESSSSVDRDRVGRLVKKYIQKFKGD